jgi:glutamate-ammonia-ligase adenylyltransferase
LLAAHYKNVPDIEAALSLLHRWAETAGLPRGEAHFLHLLYLAGTSEALFLALLRHPEQLQPLVAQVRSPLGLGKEGLDEALARLMLSKRWPSPADALAAFRYIQTARILLQDVLKILPFESVTRELSHLADVLISRSFSLTYQPLREALGLPLYVVPDGRVLPCSLAVFALGKLGGEELNYASDVDLVFFYRAEGQTDRGRPNEAFFNAWVQAATALLTSPTPDGACLKVDPNLRPRGRDGELTLPFSAALAYYRDWADLWERQAWIKARACAGDVEAGSNFLRELESIVYRPYSFSGIARQNREMREKALARLKKESPDGPEVDLKEGRGGIRDAEFSIQALQMAYGQDDRWVREGGTLSAAAKLHQKGLLSVATQSALSSGYVFLRKAEHWAQFQGMRQTHRLPRSKREWWALGAYLRLLNRATAQDAVESARKSLQEIFTATVGQLQGSDEEPDALAKLFTPESMLAVLRTVKVPDPDRALPILATIYRFLEPRLDRPSRRQNFLRLHYSLLREFQSAPEPFSGLVGMHRLVASLGSERWGAAALLDQPRLARLLFRIVSRSEPLLETVQRWPFLVRLLSYEGMRQAGRVEIQDDSLQNADRVRRWHKEILFLAQSREIIMGEDTAWSCDVHSRLADAVCGLVFSKACSEVEEMERLPAGTLSQNLCLLGLGRLGFMEMHPRSDLDLVCVKREAWVVPGEPDRSALLEGRLAWVLATAFTAVTRHGSLYDLDFRLRPYGRSGPHIQSLQALKEYFSGPARLWERLAFLKGRPVAGEAPLGRKALNSIWACAFERGAPESELPALLELRQRLEAGAKDLEAALKFSSGGLLHLDLLLLTLQARNGLEPAAVGTLALTERLQAAGALPHELAERLRTSRIFQDTLLHRCRLHLSKSPSLDRIEEGLAWLGRLWGASGGESPPLKKISTSWKAQRQNVVRAWKELLG